MNKAQSRLMNSTQSQIAKVKQKEIPQKTRPFTPNGTSRNNHSRFFTSRNRPLCLFDEGSKPFNTIVDAEVNSFTNL